jgi:hypothetical protein
MNEIKVAPPGWMRLALEARAPFEFAASALAAPLLLSSPQGDGHSVIVYPGFIASDMSTNPLRRLLRWLNYQTYGWGQGRNLNPSEEVFDKAHEGIRQIYEKSGRKVTLVGWSLGGLYARELAKREPDLVRQVVTLGSPFGGTQKTNASKLFEWLNDGRPRIKISQEELRTPPPVPTTSIYSRSDGVVPWQYSVDTIGPLTENIELEASHMGLGVNPLVLHALADRLSQPEGQWKPFERSGMRRFAYGKE